MSATAPKQDASSPAAGSIPKGLQERMDYFEYELHRTQKALQEAMRQLDVEKQMHVETKRLLQEAISGRGAAGEPSNRVEESYGSGTFHSMSGGLGHSALQRSASRSRATTPHRGLPGAQNATSSSPLQELLAKASSPSATPRRGTSPAASRTPRGPHSRVDVTDAVHKPAFGSRTPRFVELMLTGDHGTIRTKYYNDDMLDGVSPTQHEQKRAKSPSTSKRHGAAPSASTPRGVAAPNGTPQHTTAPNRMGRAADAQAAPSHNNPAATTLSANATRSTTLRAPDIRAWVESLGKPI